MTELLTNAGATAWPYVVVLVLCVFWLLASGLQSRASNDGKKAGPHAAWRISEGPASMRRFWQRQKRRS